jgi:hypothetical protein
MQDAYVKELWPKRGLAVFNVEQINWPMGDFRQTNTKGSGQGRRATVGDSGTLNPQIARDRL